MVMRANRVYVRRALHAHVKLFNSSSSNCSPSESKVGFVGVGFMGSKMIENMLRDGRQVCAYDKSETAVDKLIAANGTVLYSVV